LGEESVRRSAVDGHRRRITMMEYQVKALDNMLKRLKFFFDFGTGFGLGALV